MTLYGYHRLPMIVAFALFFFDRGRLIRYSLFFLPEDFGNLFGRRLGDLAPDIFESRRLFDLSDIVITINTRSDAEAQTTAADLSVSWLLKKPYHLA